MTVGIYSLYWEDQDLIYVGQSVDIYKRFKEHIRALEGSKHSNVKVQQAYKLYGGPSLRVLQECSIEQLNVLEEYWQSEFKSLDSLDIVKAGDHHAAGLSNPRAKYSKIDLLRVFRMSKNPKLTSKDISEFTKVSLAMVDDIRSGRAHKWLQEKYPKTWAKIDSSRNIRRINGYERSKGRLGKIYTFVSPEGIEYFVDNFSKFGKEHKLDSSDLSRVASGKYTHTKGWRLKSVQGTHT